MLRPTERSLVLLGRLGVWMAAALLLASCGKKPNINEPFPGVVGSASSSQLVVYPDAYHAFDAPNPKTPLEPSEHHFEFNQSATDQAAAALHEFLDATIGGKVQGQ